MNRSPKQVLVTRSVDLNVQAATVFDLPFVCQRIKQVGMLIVGSDANAQGAVVYVNWRVQAGLTTNDTSATTGNIATLKHKNTLNQQGVFIFSRPGINPATGAVYVGWNQSNGVGYATNEYIFPIGYQVTFYPSTAQGGACLADLFVECEEIDIDMSDLVYSAQTGTIGNLWSATYPGVLVTP